MLNQRELLRIESLAKKYDESNMPLYLSYPISSFWNTNLDQRIFRQSFNKTATPFFYFHFPFCSRSCYYCVCYKTTSNDPNDNDVYIKHLSSEFEHKRSLLGIDRFTRVRHMHWGGGTPTLLSCRQIEKVFTSIIRYLDFCRDDSSSISIEAYPSLQELNVDKLILLKDLGFNEISFGIQDFDKRIQETIQRNTPKKVVKDIVAISRKLGFRVHMDLCYGLPFQGLNEITSTVQTVIDMSPDRVALFAYAHYPLSFPLQRKIPISAIPNSFIRVLLNMAASELFKANGYYQVGHDHYVKENDPLFLASKKGDVVRDFMGYSVEQRRQFIGFGNAAISFLGNVFFHNAISLEKYYALIENNVLPLQSNLGHILSEDDQIRNELIQRHILGNFIIPKQLLSDKYSIDFLSYFSAELEALKRFESDDLVVGLDDDTISLRNLGKYFSRHIAYIFDNYR